MTNVHNTVDRQHVPWGGLAAFGFFSNLAWELAQCPFLYDMTGWSSGKQALYMSAAVAGDIFIVIGIVAASWLSCGRSVSRLLTRLGWTVTIVLGLIASIVLEWIARELDLWNYSALMPTISVGGEAIGLSPVVQVTLLPSLSLYLATSLRAGQRTRISREP